MRSVIGSPRQFLYLHWRFALAALSAFFVLLLLGTGILLNHSRELGLEKMPLQISWLRSRYETTVLMPNEAEGLVHRLPAGDLQVRAGELRLNGERLGACPRLIGVVEQAGQILVVCSGRLLLLTPDGELIRQADNLRDIPEGLSAVARDQGRVLLQGHESSFAVDLQDLSVSQVAPLPEADDTPMRPAGDAAPNWREVVRDLHSGRLLGDWGVWLMEAMAVLFAMLAIPALWSAYRRRA